MRKDWPSPAKGWLTSGEVPADEMPALQELLRVALRFREKAASQADLDVAQEEFNLSCARAKIVKKKKDEQNVKTPWAPVVASTSQTTSEVVAAITDLGRKADSRAVVMLAKLDRLGELLKSICDVSLALSGV